MRDELEEARHEVLADNTAQAVFKHLARLTDEKGRFSKRWVWELMQNARDAAPEGGVSIEVIADHEKLIFRHNGLAFSRKGIAHLIYHGSTKYDQADPIGQFGTGFITTHLLSKRIGVRGWLDDGRFFQFTLDRHGSTHDELAKAMDTSSEAFTASLATNVDSVEEFTTEFVYPLHADGGEAVLAGLDDLIANAPLVLAFNDRIRCLRLPGHRFVVEVSKQGMETLEDTRLVRVCIVQKDGEDQVSERYVAVLAGGDVHIAVDLKKAQANTWTVEGHRTVPRIFVAFPLTGTEDFPVPIVVNSHLLEPREDRDSLKLKGDSQANLKNKKLIETACSLVPTLATFASTQGWIGVDSLAFIPDHQDKEWLEAAWMKSTLARHVIDPIRSSTVLRNSDAALIRPIDSWIPMPCDGVTVDDLRAVLCSLREASSKLPNADDATAWSRNLTSWCKTTGNATESFSESFDLLRLCKMVASCGTVARLRQLLTEGVDSISWLGRLHEIIAAAGRTKLFDELKLLPSQNGDLRLRSHLKRDDGVDPVLKDIAESLGIDIRVRLLDPGIRLPDLLKFLEGKESRDVLDETLDNLKELAEDEPTGDRFKSGSVSLFKWLVTAGDLDALDGFPVYSRAGANAEGVRSLNISSHAEEDVTLAPIGCWSEAARRSSTLFPASNILADAYFGVATPAQWSDLAEHKIIRLAPLFTARKHIATFVPDEPLPEKDDKGKKHRSKLPIDVTEIAFLETESTGLDAVRKSKSRGIDLLKFIIGYALPADHRALEIAEIECECGEKHRCYRAAWLIPLSERRWVPLGDGKQAPATAESLAALLKDQRENPALLTEGDGARLLAALKISVADLLLRTVAEDESSRVSYLSSASELMHAVDDDAAKAKLIASELNRSRDLIEQILRHRERREKVERNQQVGALVETLLKRGMETRGLRVTRTGVGSDYEVENDIIVEGREVLLEIRDDTRSFLIEVKATTLTTVRMTVAQARAATEQRDRFALCMVKLDGPEITQEMVERTCRFMSDIGHRLERAWDGYNTLEFAKADATRPSDGIELVVTESQTRFAVGDEVWASGMGLADAVAYFCGIR